MIELVLVIAALFTTYSVIRQFKRKGGEDVASPKTSTRLKKLWEYVDTAFKQKKWRTAERALLSILRIDHKNTAAYNRLGMLYAKQKNYEDAVECFEIASGLAPTIASLYNLGLVHLEQKDYQRAATSFERVIDLEPTAKRYIAYAKVQELLNNPKKVVDALEKALAQEESREILELLATAYDNADETEKAHDIKQKLAAIRADELLRSQIKAKRARRSVRQVVKRATTPRQVPKRLG